MEPLPAGKEAGHRDLEVRGREPEAAAASIQKVSYILPVFASEARIELTRRIKSRMPAELNRIYFCSGGLLADQGQTGTPYFLTANHCLSRDREAGTVETYFFFVGGCDECFSPASAVSGSTGPQPFRQTPSVST